MRIVVFALCCFLMAGCGLSHTIDGSALSGLAADYKLVLFDVENAVGIAIDERDSLHGAMQQIKQDISDAQEHMEEAEDDAERAQQKGQIKRAEISELAIRVFELKIEYLESQLELLRQRRRVQGRIVLVAQAKYELEKAKLIKRNNAKGAVDIDLEDFEEQVKQTVVDARGGQEDLAEEAKEVEELRLSWQKGREALSKASGGGLGSEWAEVGTPWRK